MEINVAVDTLFRGEATGPVAKRLLANKFDLNALRVWSDRPDSPAYMDKIVGNQHTVQRVVGNATLLKDEWKHLDEAVLPIATQRLVGVQDLRSRGLVYRVPNAMGKTVLEYEDASDMEAAQINMSGVSKGRNDRLEFDLNYLPLPIVHADFQINARVLQAARDGRMPLDTAQVQVATRKVSEKVEEILFAGASSFAFGGGTLYGYADFTHRNSYTLAYHWNDSGATGATILADVKGMKQASIDDRHYGPWILYVPTNFETALDDDFKAASDKSIRQRLLEISGIQEVKVADFLTADNAILVEMQPETVRIIEGFMPTVVEWDSEGGMIFHFKVMAILVPQLRADQGDRCGIVHGTK